MSIIERAIQAARTKTSGQASPLPKALVAGKAGRQPAQPVPAGPTESIPFAELACNGHLITETENRTLFEQFRRLKRPLLQSVYGPLSESGVQIVLVTSPLPGAGKTFITSNLAHVLAMEKDRRVLLIDMDNTRQSLTQQLGMTGRTGLFDVINDESLAIEEAVYATDIPGLSVLPSGQKVPDALERLSSTRCKETFRQLLAVDPSRILILDGPPLLMTNEGPAIAALAGQILLVIEAGVTPKSSVTTSLELLDLDKPIGMILNKTPGNLGPDFYYHY